MKLEEFRRQLRQEADRWLSESLIDRSQYEQLAARYSFNTLDVNARSNFAIILIGLGGILVGLGTITFVAANWQGMSRELRAGLLFTVLLAANWLGFRLWQHAQRWQRLGQALLLLGAFVMGANIALMGQIFHVTGSLYALLFMWGFAVLAMAYSLRYIPLGVMALILIGLGYWYHFTESWLATAADTLALAIAENMLAIAALLFVPLAYWCRSRSISILALAIVALAYSNHIIYPTLSERNFVAWFLVQYLPMVAALLFLPLAYYLRSRAVFILSGLLILAGLVPSIAYLREFNLPSYFLGAIAIFLIPLLPWAYDNALFGRLFSRLFGHERAGSGIDLPNFTPLARGLGLVILSIACYAFSFYGAWNWRGDASPLGNIPTFDRWPSLVNIVLFTGCAIVSYLRLFRLPRNSGEGDAKKGQIAIGVLCAIAALPILWHGGLGQIPEVATFIYNVLLFLIAVGLIRESLEKSQRIPFWAGVILLIMQILSRLFEYDTALLLKAFVFVLCGIGVSVAGIWFERHMRLSSPHTSNIDLPSTTED
ncbi:DUF2157 domain-containing protein [Pseudanabaena sp. PCC 6802]|uniref:DUF2157 domain-containing protein n=1 Tax=Pseudanabaena sp. PCC 6802 TaxID=118173 RepID=UPI00034B324E|nr:DUF2157 domain-containing protein [Pseudanabaena sp. PCC 6802]